MFRLGGRVWIMAASLLAIIVINAAMALIMSREIADLVIHREAQVKQDFINRLFQAQKPGAALFRPPHPSPALALFASHVTELPDVIRTNIYSPDRFIRYSTQEGLIGVKFDEPNSELDEAFAGGLIASLETATRASKAEHLALPLKPGEFFIEAYIPVIGADGKVAAVVELYKRPTGTDTIIAGLRSLVWLSAGLGGLVLFIALCAMFIWGAGRKHEAG
jgi:hypothetical protein